MGSEIHVEGDRTWCGACLSRLVDFFGESFNIGVCRFQIKTAEVPWQWSYFERVPYQTVFIEHCFSPTSTA